jgi:hypothetical protein
MAVVTALAVTALADTGLDVTDVAVAALIVTALSGYSHLQASQLSCFNHALMLCCSLEQTQLKSVCACTQYTYECMRI